MPSVSVSLMSMPVVDGCEAAVVPAVTTWYAWPLVNSTIWPKVTAVELARGAPYGVGYFVGTWDPGDRP